jgi:ribosome maturation factor RimP
MRRDQVEEHVGGLADEVCQDLGLSFVDCKYRKSEGVWRIIVRIDRPNGVSIDDCAAVSRSLSDKLDEGDPIEHQYTLEVSSAGLSDPLKTDDDFRRFIGRPVEVDLHPARRQAHLERTQPRAGSAKRQGKAQTPPIIGTLVGFSPGTIAVQVGEETKQIERGSIRRARPAVDFKGRGASEDES